MSHILSQLNQILLSGLDDIKSEYLTYKLYNFFFYIFDVRLYSSTKFKNSGWKLPP